MRYIVALVFTALVVLGTPAVASARPMPHDHSISKSAACPLVRPVLGHPVKCGKVRKARKFRKSMHVVRVDVHPVNDGSMFTR